MLKKTLKLASRFSAALALGTMATIYTPDTEASATISVIASSGTIAHNSETSSKIAASATPEEAMKNGLAYSLTHNFDECKQQMNLAQTDPQKISNKKAREFYGCLEKARYVHRMNAGSLEEGRTEYDMSARTYGYVSECRDKHSNWEQNKSLTKSEFDAVGLCHGVKETAHILKWGGGIAGGAFALFGLGLYATRQRPS